MDNKIKPDILNWSEGKVKGFHGKEFINLEKGAVKLVKIDPSANFPEHLHPDKTEYAYVVEGTPEFVIDHESYQSEVGDFFVFPTGKKHEIKNNANKTCILLIGSIKN